MLCGFRQRRLVVALAFALVAACAHGAAAQDRDEFDETAADPVKLFNRGQEAHAKKEYERALELYEEALQIKPEFAEAEFQKAAAMIGAEVVLGKVGASGRRPVHDPLRLATAYHDIFGNS